MRSLIRLIIFPLALFLSVNLSAQEPSENLAGAPFKFPTLINCQSSKVLAPKTFEFEIQHRFGQFGVDESAFKSFLGMDLPANIRFGLRYALNDRLHIGVGRTKFEKTYDLETKYLAIRQKKDKGSPVNVAVYFNANLVSDDFPDADDRFFHSDSITPFDYEFAHRLSYLTQIIVSRKFSHRLSVQVVPTLVYQNLVKADQENLTLAVPVAARIKTGIKSSLVLEYAYIVDGNKSDHLDPFSIALEIGTVGHSFQFFATTSGSILQQNVYSASTTDYENGKFLLGFNINRTFWRKKKP
jgi:hypothetical protein